MTRAFKKLTVAALAGSAAASCMVGAGACPVHCGHLPIGHRDLVGVGLVAVRAEAERELFFLGGEEKKKKKLGKD